MTPPTDPVAEVHGGMSAEDLWKAVKSSTLGYYGGAIGRVNQSPAKFRASAGGESYVHAALKVATSAHLLHLVHEPITVEYEKQFGKKYLDVAYWVPSESAWSGAECEEMASCRIDPEKILETLMKGDDGLRVRFLVVHLLLYDDLLEKRFVHGDNFREPASPCPACSTSLR